MSSFRISSIRIIFTQVCFDISVSARTSNTPVGRKKRAANAASNLVVKFNSYKCFYDDCKPPPDPNTVPPVDKRPSKAELWSDKATWNGTEPGWGGYNNGSFDLPVDGDNVKIPEGTELLKTTLL